MWIFKEIAIPSLSIILRPIVVDNFFRLMERVIGTGSIWFELNFIRVIVFI